MDLNEIRDLLNLVAQSGVAEVEVESGDLKLVIRRNAPSVLMQSPAAMMPPGFPSYPPSYGMPPYAQGMPPSMPSGMMPQGMTPPAPMPPTPVAPPPPAPAAAPEPVQEEPAEGDLVRAPIVGTYYSKPSPDADPFVTVGTTVEKGQTLCIIEAMKIMNEIEAEVDGVIAKILVEDAQAVEYDQPLFVMASA